MQKKQKNNLKNKKFVYNKNNSLYLKNKKFIYNKNSFLNMKNITEKKEKKIKINNQNHYLYRNKKLKKGVFLKKPKFNEIMYPFFLNMKLINEYLKKK